MPDDPTIAETPARTTTPSAGETPAGAATATPEPEFDRDRAMATINNLRQFERQAKDQAKVIADMEARLKAIDDAKLSETEKANKLAQEASERATTLETQLRTERAQLAIEREARRLNIVDSETAALIISGRLEFDADGKPSNVASLLEQLVKDKPFLLATGAGTTRPGAGAGITNPGQQPAAGTTL